MTREDAIDMVKYILETMPKEPPTECDYVEEWFYEDNKIRKSLNMAIKALEQQPKTGYWIKEESPFGWDGHSYQCSECGRSIHLDTEVEDLDDYPYCHCGAKMQEKEE